MSFIWNIDFAPRLQIYAFGTYAKEESHNLKSLSFIE
jgi:hypothetical protein